MPTAGVAHRELMATAATAQQPLEQRPSGVRRTRLLRPPHVLGDDVPDSLELLPAHVTVVRPRDQRQPLLARFAAMRFARLPLAILDPMFALAIRVRATIGRV